MDAKDRSLSIFFILSGFAPLSSINRPAHQVVKKNERRMIVVPRYGRNVTELQYLLGCLFYEDSL
jgi:hypothetical protein